MYEYQHYKSKCIIVFEILEIVYRTLVYATGKNSNFHILYYSLDI